MRNALTVLTPELRQFTRLHVQPRRIAQLPRLVPPVPAVSLSVTQLGGGQTLVRRPAGEGRAIVAGHLVAALAAVVCAVAAEKQGDAPSAAAGEFIFSAQQPTCDVTNTEINTSAENTPNICRLSVFAPNKSRTRIFPRALCVF